MGLIDDPFEEWWDRDGRMIDPDTDDVPWFDKRRGLAEAAFHAATAQSRNYVADDSENASVVTFANGRIVTWTGHGLSVRLVCQRCNGTGLDFGDAACRDCNGFGTEQ